MTASFTAIGVGAIALAVGLLLGIAVLERNERRKRLPLERIVREVVPQLLNDSELGAKRQASEASSETTSSHPSELPLENESPGRYRRDRNPLQELKRESRVRNRTWWLAPTWAYLAGLAVVGLGFRTFAGDAVIASTSELQILAQLLPATILALFAVAFASLFTATQQVLTLFSVRAPLILLRDRRVGRIVTRTAILVVIALLLSTQVNGGRLPTSVVQAGYEAILLATILLVVQYGRFVIQLLAQYSAPRTFVENVLANADRELATSFRLVRFKVPLLGQALQNSLRRDDSESLAAALEGLVGLQRKYVDVVEQKPSARTIVVDSGRQVEGWISQDVVSEFVRAGQLALQIGTPEFNMERLGDEYWAASRSVIEAGLFEEARTYVYGLSYLGTSAQQVNATTINLWPRPAALLARMEPLIEEHIPALGPDVILCWLVCICYPEFHLGYVHRAYAESIESFGPNPAWDDARALVNVAGLRLWANKFPPGSDEAMRRKLDEARHAVDLRHRVGGDA